MIETIIPLILSVVAAALSGYAAITARRKDVAQTADARASADSHTVAAMGKLIDALRVEISDLGRDLAKAEARQLEFRLKALQESTDQAAEIRALRGQLVTATQEILELRLEIKALKREKEVNRAETDILKKEKQALQSGESPAPIPNP